MKLPRKFFEPLAAGAPRPFRDPPVRLERMIHFVPPHIDKVRAKVGELAGQVDVVLGNLEDAVPVEAKAAARAGKRARRIRGATLRRHVAAAAPFHLPLSAPSPIERANRPLSPARPSRRAAVF